MKTWIYLVLKHGTTKRGIGELYVTKTKRERIAFKKENYVIEEEEGEFRPPNKLKEEGKKWHERSKTV